MPFVTSVDGTKISYEVRGNGPALLLVDGAMCSRQMGPMPAIAEALSDAFAVWIFDRRGRGESGNNLPWSMDKEVEDIRSLAAAAGKGVMIFGISSGAILAAKAATQLPDLKKLALFEGPMIVDDAHAPLAKNFVAETEALVARGDKGGAVKKFMKLVGVPSFMVTIMPLFPFWKKVTLNASTLPYDLSIVEPYQQGCPLDRADWAAISAETLVMDGGKSPTYMRNSQRQWAGVLPHARYQTLPGQTHNVKTEAIVPVLREFFS